MVLRQPNPFYIKFTLLLLMFSLLGLIIYLGREIIVPLAFAFLLAVLLLPVNKFLERKGMSRVWAISVSLTMSTIVAGSILYYLSQQIMSFVDDIPVIKQHLTEHVQTLKGWMSSNINLSKIEQRNLFDSAAEKLKTTGSGVLGDTFLTVTQLAVVMLLLPVYIFLILYYRDMIARFFITIFKSEHQAKVHDVLQESKSIVQGYMTGLLIEMGIVATINCLGFLILGIKYPIFLGVLSAILNLIPYIGMLIASVFCMLVTLTTSASMSDVGWVLAILVVVQFLDNNIIMPFVVGSKLKINSLITILGVLTGGALAGVAGMFLSIPFIAILKVIFDRVENLKPWGLILGDDVTGRKSGMYLTFERIANRSRVPSPIKPPDVDEQKQI